MYITLDVSNYRYLFDFMVPSNLPKPDFKPARLVRIYDMAVVNGSDVNEGYCALSYSWNQSGEILCNEATGKYKRIDEGKHKIISNDSYMFPDRIISYSDAIINKKLRKIYEVLNIMYKNMYCFTKNTKYVQFEGIIQKICQLFNIKYIWYDQMCINQVDKEEKQREIRNMHLIYSNAYCAVALVPEYRKSKSRAFGENEEEYFKRLWTLEEALKSKKLLIVGRDTSIWADCIPDFELSKQASELNVAQILRHAHQRTSTKEHDRVFALIQLFPEFMQHINIDYNQPLEDLMIRFYGLLAEKDIRILLFRNKRYYNSTIQKYKFLPSWTGVDGLHKASYSAIFFQDYDIIGKTMNVTSKFITNGQPIDNDVLTIRKEHLPPPPGDMNDYNSRWYFLHTSFQLPGSSETRNVLLHGSYYNIVVKECFDGISKRLLRLSRFIKMKKENLYWRCLNTEEYRKVLKIDINKLTENVDDLSAQYIILSEISFKDKYNHLYYPIIKKKQEEEYYKAIGCCKITDDIFFDCNLPKQTFSIQ